MKIGFISLILLFVMHTSLSVLAQVPVVNFKNFQPVLEKNNDTTYVINFWATWCAPCVKELPDFERINQKYKDKKFKMLLVSLDFRKSLDKRLIPFVASNKLKAEVILLHESDANSWINQVDRNWSGAIPATLIYNKDFRVFHEGGYTFNELDLIITNNLIP